MNICRLCLRPLATIPTGLPICTDCVADLAKMPPEARMRLSLALLELMASEERARGWKATGDALSAIRSEVRDTIEDERGSRMPWEQN